MLGKIVKIIKELYQKRLDRIRCLSDMAYDHNLVSPYLSSARELSAVEKKEIANKWGEIIPYLERGYEFYKALIVLDKFSPDYLPASYYSPIIENTLNPIRYKIGLSHKSMSQLLYSGIVDFPQTILRSYNGILFDEAYNPITVNRAVDILKSEHNSLLYKPALLTAQGKGISILSETEIQKFCKNLHNSDMPYIDSDFIIQRLVEQSPDTKKFNSSSLNCLRITTLNLNGYITVCTRAIKCGPINSIVDNIGTGKRGVAVGIHEDGFLHDYGFYGNGEKTKSHNNVTFEGNRIPNFDNILEKAKELHSVNSSCKLIGWDLALDKYNKVVLIEGNTVCPSISFEQMATGPVFGERTDEVIDYVKYQKKT